jgi:hypothetical protein
MNAARASLLLGSRARCSSYSGASRSWNAAFFSNSPAGSIAPPKAYLAGSITADIEPRDRSSRGSGPYP